MKRAKEQYMSTSNLNQFEVDSVTIDDMYVEYYIPGCLSDSPTQPLSQQGLLCEEHARLAGGVRQEECQWMDRYRIPLHGKGEFGKHPQSRYEHLSTMTFETAKPHRVYVVGVRFDDQGRARAGQRQGSIQGRGFWRRYLHSQWRCKLQVSLSLVL